MATWIAGATAAGARADTIVLKNGRRIFASFVTEEDGKVSYETAAGKFSLPKSIVDHVERGTLGPVDGPGGDAAGIAITPPPVETGSRTGSGAVEEVRKAAVHDGAIDREFIAKMELQARGRGPEAGERAAIAHHAASEFHLQRGNLNEALAEERTALTFAPEQAGLLLNVAYLHLRRSEYKAAMDYLERARRVRPRSAEVAKLAGWAFFGMNRMRDAVDEWQRALDLHPDAEVQAALAKAKHDLGEEQNYRENESSHFSLKYSGASAPGLARNVLRTLERHFSAIESELSFTPREPIGVVLYTQEAFADITRAPEWVGALNDGRIRVPVQGLTSMTPELSRVLKHELTHSFLAQKTHGRCPVWLSEGLAQWMEGKRSPENAAGLLEVYDHGQAAPLAMLEGSWIRFPGDVASYAYAWALANVEWIVQTQGMGDMTGVLDRIAHGATTEAALQEVLRNNYNEVTRATADYLRKTYLH